MRHSSFRRFLLTLACVFSLLLSYAQEKTITGVVSDKSGTTLPGATISIKGAASSTTTTDINGKFSLKIPDNVKTLVVSFVGMENQELEIGRKTDFSVVLNPLVSSLNDVVVIGYGSTKRSNVTSAISSVKAEDLKNLPVAGIDQALQGKVAGVTVSSNGGQPGGGVSVRVRGITSVSTSANGNEPLYVIDGVPLVAQSTSLEQNFLGGGSGSTGQSVLATLNSSDFESIEILKDASAQAIYGSRAANGVVLITTKKGKAGQGKISYDVYYGIQEIPKKLSVMNLRQNAEYMNSLVNEVRAVPGSGLDSIGEFKNPSVLGHGTDWQDEIYQQGNIVNHQLSFSGGSQKTTYYFSGGYFDQTGTLIETGFKRYNMRATIDQQVKNWLKAGFSTNLSRSDQKIGLADGFDAVTSTVLYNSPATPVRDIFGNFISQNVIGGSTFGNPNNPVALASLRNVRNVSSKAFGAIYADASFLKYFNYRIEANYDFTLRAGKAYQPFLQNPNTKAIILSPSKLREERNNSLYWALKNYLNYNQTFGVHSVSALAGHESQQSTYDYINANRNDLVLNLPSLNAGAAGDGSGEGIGAGAGKWAMESFFARGTYSYDQRYTISATIRRDGSSSFGPGKRWGSFRGISGAWTISNEAFLKEMKNLNYLKLRFGVGEVGNQNVSGQNAYISNIVLQGAAPFGPGGLQYNVEYPNLAWEANTSYNAGIDVTLFDKKIEASVDVYKKITTNMLLQSQQAMYSGLGTSWNDVQTPFTNDGEMVNKGIDISITSNNIQNNNFSWKTTLIFSHYKNRLNRLNAEDAIIKGEFNEYGTLNLVTLTKQGNSVGSFFGYVTDGLFRSMDELNNGINYGLPVEAGRLWLGDVRFKDLNNDKVVDDRDVAFIGNPNPKFTYGFTNSFNYKGIDLSIFLQGSYGADIFNYSRRQTEAMSSAYNNQLTTVLNRYTATNPNGTLPRYNQWHSNNIRISDRYIEDGSYLRIQNVSLGYNLPKKIIGKAMINSARLYISAQNIYTFTKYSGYDPELGAFNNAVTFMNVDNGHYPNPRSFTFGANIEF